MGWELAVGGRHYAATRNNQQRFHGRVRRDVAEEAERVVAGIIPSFGGLEWRTEKISMK
jgi:hypothetical protein